MRAKSFMAPLVIKRILFLFIKNIELLKIISDKKVNFDLINEKYLD